MGCHALTLHRAAARPLNVNGKLVPCFRISIPITVNALQSMSHTLRYPCVRNACGRQGTPVPIIWRHARSYFAHRPLPSRAFLYQR